LKAGLGAGLVPVAAAVLWKRFCVEKQWGDTTAAMEGVVKDLRLEAMNLW
jgi:hypothetical protein